MRAMKRRRAKARRTQGQRFRDANVAGRIRPMANDVPRRITASGHHRPGHTLAEKYCAPGHGKGRHQEGHGDRVPFGPMCAINRKYSRKPSPVHTVAAKTARPRQTRSALRPATTEPLAQRARVCPLASCRRPPAHCIPKPTFARSTVRPVTGIAKSCVVSNLQLSARPRRARHLRRAPTQVRQRDPLT